MVLELAGVGKIFLSLGDSQVITSVYGQYNAYAYSDRKINSAKF